MSLADTTNSFEPTVNPVNLTAIYIFFIGMEVKLKNFTVFTFGHRKELMTELFENRQIQYSNDGRENSDAF